MGNTTITSKYIKDSLKVKQRSNKFPESIWYL